LGELFFKIHDLLDLNQEPPVDLRQVENLLEGKAGAQGVADEEDAFGVGQAQFAADDVAREHVAVAMDFRADAPRLALAAQPLRPISSERRYFCRLSLKVRLMAIASPIFSIRSGI